MTGVLGALLPALAYLLVREFSRKDQIGEELRTLAHVVNNSLRELHTVVSTLTLAVEEIRTWSHERFVTRQEHTDVMFGVRRELDKCQDRCSSKCEE
jgi:hypothetical protein